MKTAQLFKLPLTAIMVKDPNIGGFTAFFKQFPEIIAEGDTDGEALQNLMNAVYDVFEYRSKLQSENIHHPSSEIIERDINFCLDSH